MDNAVEHLKSHTDLVQEINIAISSDVTLNISNEVCESIITDIHLFDSFGYSTKTNSTESGYGLYNARNIANKNNYKLDINNSDSNIIFNLKSS